MSIQFDNAGMYLKNPDGTDTISSSHPSRFSSSGDQWTLACLFTRDITGGGSFQRMFSNASGSNGGNGYEANSTYSASDQRMTLLMAGSGSNVTVDLVDAYAVNDLVAAFFSYNYAGDEAIYASYNRSDVSLLKTSNVFNENPNPIPTGNSKLSIGYARWSNGKWMKGTLHRVILYNRPLGYAQMNWMAKSRFANYSRVGLVSDWRMRPRNRFNGDSIVSGDIVVDHGPANVEFNEVQGTNAPVVVKTNSFAR